MKKLGKQTYTDGRLFIFLCDYMCTKRTIFEVVNYGIVLLFTVRVGISGGGILQIFVLLETLQMAKAELGLELHVIPDLFDGVLVEELVDRKLP